MILSGKIMCIAGKSNRENPDTWLPFWLHSMDTAETMSRLALEWLPEMELNYLSERRGLDDLVRICHFLAMVHDIGKLTVAFQRKLDIPGYWNKLERNGIPMPVYSFPTNGIKKYPHGLTGEKILQYLNVPQEIATIVGSHHGKPQGYGNPSVEESPIEYCGERPEEQIVWKGLWSEWLNYSLENAGYKTLEELPHPDIKEQMLLIGLLIMADWIASNETYFPYYSLAEKIEPKVVSSRAESAWSKLNLPSFWEVYDGKMNEKLFQNRFSFLPNRVQRAVLEKVNDSGELGLLIVESQMGSGKTEAALAAAEVIAGRRRAGGLFFGLPTQATADGVFSRLTDWAGEQAEKSSLAIRLAHGAAALNEDYRAMFQGKATKDADWDGGELMIHSWFEGAKQAMLANFVIGTVDQLLMAALKQKHVMLRHLGLAGKIVIVDECHAYDAYMNQFLDCALAWLGAYHVPVIILSATLPAARRAELIDAYQNRKKKDRAQGDWRTCRSYPLLTWTDGETVNQTAVSLQEPGREVILGRVSEGQIAEYLDKALCGGGCAGIIVNTVKKAQRIAKTLQKNLPDYEVMLFHSQFLMPDRAEREKLLVRRVGKKSLPEQRDGLIVVGTQVLEQSLDLDFDLMLTELCPMDLLLQRIGRLHRHERVRPEGLMQARCLLISSGDGEFDSGSLAVYGEWILLRTGQLLPDSILLPYDIPRLVQDVYETPDIKLLSETEQKAWDEHTKHIERQRSNAEGYRLMKPPKAKSRFASIAGMLDHDAGAAGEAAVRDGDPSVEVLVMVQRDDKSLGFLPWQNGGEAVSWDRILDDETARKIAAQRLRLPRYFCVPYRINRTIAELEKMSEPSVYWQKAPLLRGALFLFLNEQGKGLLCDRELWYDKNTGLQMMETEGQDGKTGI